jgi:hypothetical protein
MIPVAILPEQIGAVGRLGRCACSQPRGGLGDWPVDILNGLMIAERRRRIYAARRRGLSEFLGDPPGTLDALKPCSTGRTLPFLLSFHLHRNEPEQSICCGPVQQQRLRRAGD